MRKQRVRREEDMDINITVDREVGNAADYNTTSLFASSNINVDKKVGNVADYNLFFFVYTTCRR